MGTTVDSLDIQIAAQAGKANQSLDALVRRLDKITSSLTRAGGTGMNQMAVGVSRLSSAMQKMNAIGNADFTRLANNMSKLSAVDAGKLRSSAVAIGGLTKSLSNLSNVRVSDNAKQISDLAHGIAQLGYKSATQAIQNIPKLAISMRDLMTTLSGAPRVSQNLIDMTNALARLARTGSSSGRAATSLSSALNTYSRSTTKAKNNDIRISDILDRKNELIRPPMANLDVMFISMAAASPAPVIPTIDKLICIAEHNDIEPVIIIGKCDLAPEYAKELQDIYKKAGFDAFVLSAKTGEGVDAIREFVNTKLDGKTSAFAGASGIGKSTLLNALFPDLSLTTNTISVKIQRGRHTTRHVELYPISEKEGAGYIADTPGFSLLDFERFNFFDKEDLAYNMREFRDYIGECRYTKCSHTKEEGCAILEAVREGKISKSRHDSFLEIYDSLKNKHKWDNK